MVEKEKLVVQEEEEKKEEKERYKDAGVIRAVLQAETMRAFSDGLHPSFPHPQALLLDFQRVTNLP